MYEFIDKITFALFFRFEVHVFVLPNLYEPVLLNIQVKLCWIFQHKTYRFRTVTLYELSTKYLWIFEIAAAICYWWYEWVVLLPSGHVCIVKERQDNLSMTRNIILLKCIWFNQYIGVVFLFIFCITWLRLWFLFQNKLEVLNLNR